MSRYSSLNRKELIDEYKTEKKRYDALKEQNYVIDMSRGKPGADQLALSSAIFKTVNDELGYLSVEGTDCRNYGILGGIYECKKMFADMLDVKPENVIVGGNSSLSLMYDYIAQCMLDGVSGCTPWCKLPEVKFLCPAPGYDRHFGICEHFGIKMISIPMLWDGPDIAALESYMDDPSVKGMFCVPKYSNPQGITFSDEIVRRIAALKPASKDFRIIWDNAYCVHDITDKPDVLLNIFSVLPEYSNDDMVVEFASTSKISFPGAGVSAITASERNIREILKRLSAQIICYDKINQLFHARYFKSNEDIARHMKLHAEIIRPKFETVLNTLEDEIGDKGIAQWNSPNGGYFISLDVLSGSAARVGALCRECGLTITKVGATFPYGKDPNDRNIRIAPTFPSVKELETAALILCISVKIACLESLLMPKKEGSIS